MTDTDLVTRYFTSYSGIRLPLKLVGELAVEDMRNRNTFFKGGFDAGGRLRRCEKLVYGEIEFCHEYSYHTDGRLVRAVIHEAGEDPETIDYPT